MLLAALVSLALLASTFDPDAAAQAEADRQYHAAVARATVCVPSFDFPIPATEVRDADPVAERR